MSTQPLKKLQMLKRLQFSKNLPTAIRAANLLNGQLREDQVNGGFLTAVLRNDYQDAIKRADDHNLAALAAKDWTVQKCMFIAPDKKGYVIGESYYLKIKTTAGNVEVTPAADSDAEALIYFDLLSFSYEFKATI